MRNVKKARDKLDCRIRPYEERTLEDRQIGRTEVVDGGEREGYTNGSDVTPSISLVVPLIAQENLTFIFLRYPAAYSPPSRLSVDHLHKTCPTPATYLIATPKVGHYI